MENLYRVWEAWEEESDNPPPLWQVIYKIRDKLDDSGLVGNAKNNLDFHESEK